MIVVMLRILKIFFLLTIFIALTSCTDFKQQMTDIKSMMNTEAEDNFEPKEFVVEKQNIIQEIIY